MAAVLMGKASGFVDWLGIVCSSWVAACRGSTRRSWVLPHGYVHYASVAVGNLMAARFLGTA